MAAWTWMRYSYCWVIDARVATRPARDHQYDRWPAGAYVELHSEGCAFFSGHIFAPDGPHLGIVLTKQYPGGFRYVHWGRLSCVHGADFGGAMGGENVPYMALDNAASRFHPASVAGLVVGAMGCFIFGLYLRRWLREREAAA
jgi:hypothetical protein